MSAGNMTEASDAIGDFFPDDETELSGTGGPMIPILRSGLALAGVALMLFCFICFILFLLQRRKRRNIAPQDSTFTASRDDQLTVAEEDSMDEESAQVICPS